MKIAEEKKREEKTELTTKLMTRKATTLMTIRFLPKRWPMAMARYRCRQHWPRETRTSSSSSRGARKPLTPWEPRARNSSGQKSSRSAVGTGMMISTDSSATRTLMMQAVMPQISLETMSCQVFTGRVCIRYPSSPRSPLKNRWMMNTRVSTIVARITAQ